MSSGWIKLHRPLLEHWVSSEPELLAVWIRLLLEANHSQSKKLFNGSLITIERGQLVFGLDAFSVKSKVSVGKLRRYLKTLEQDGMISRQITSKFSVITIACYDNHQGDDKQVAGKVQACDKQITSKSQYYKNVKKERKEDLEIDRFDEWWSLYPKKSGKKAVLAKWKSRNLNSFAETLIADVKKRNMLDRKWIDGFAPNPLTYINGDRWEDEISEASNERQQTGSASRAKQHSDKLDEIARASIERERAASGSLDGCDIQEDAGALWP